MKSIKRLSAARLGAMAASIIVAFVVISVLVTNIALSVPTQQQDCSRCHGLGQGIYRGTVTATPSTSGPSPGARYTVAINVSSNPGGSYGAGYWIAASDQYGNTNASTGVYGGGEDYSGQSFTASMVAPSSPGTYYYKVFGQDGPPTIQGQTNFARYSITVGGTGGDTTAPTVASTSPVNGGSAAVSAYMNVSASFSEPLSAGTVNTSSFTLKQRGSSTALPAQVSYNNTNNTATLAPNASLANYTTYDATLTTGITDLAGNHLQNNYSWSFSTSPPSKDYYFSWYDMLSAGMRDWVIMGNPASASTPMGFNVSLGSRLKNSAPYSISPGQTYPASFSGAMGGPVKVQSLDGTPAIVSRRTLYGDSLEEINGFDQSRLDSHYYFTWYDAVSPGSRNWVLINNPGTTAVNADVYIAGRKMNASPYLINPGSSATPEFRGIMGGPVEVLAYEPNNSMLPRQVFATQRVLWQGNFNEVTGVPAAELSNDYMYTWYDQKTAGARNWVMVSNPDLSQSLKVEISIAGRKMTDSATGDQYRQGNPYFTVAPGRSITPTFPGVLNGPVEVKGYNSATYDPANPGAPNMNFLTSQRSLFGNSFEEVPGFDKNTLAAQYYFTWYDQQSPGSANWILVSNPGNSSVNAEFWIAGQRRRVMAIAPGQTVTPTFPGVMSGPVEVRGYNSSTYNPNNPGTPNSNVLTSQRVLWKNHFNEVQGIVLQ